MIPTAEFLVNLKEQGVKISVSSGKLKVKAPRDANTRQLLEEIKERKPEILAFLEERGDPPARVEDQDHYPVTLGQQAMWQCEQSEELATRYNMPYVLFPGPMDPETLQKAITDLLSRHEILRTRYHLVGNAVRQSVLPIAEIGDPVSVTDLTTDENAGETCQRIIQKEKNTPFRLDSELLFRVNLCLLPGDQTMLNITVHHIGMDGISFTHMMQDLTRLYLSRAGNPGLGMTPLSFQFRDFAVWLNKKLSGSYFLEHRTYLRAKLTKPVTSLPLPVNYTGNSARRSSSYPVAASSYKISKTLYKALTAYASTAHATHYVLMASAMFRNLQKLTGLTDLLVGAVTSGREDWAMQEQIGNYTTLMVLRVETEPGESPESLLEKTRKEILVAKRYQAYPYDYLLAENDLPWIANGQSFTDILLNWQQGGGGDPGKEENRTETASVQTQAHENRFGEYMLSFNHYDSGEDLELVIEYAEKIYSGDMIAGLGNGIISTLENMVNRQQIPAGKEH